MTELTSALATIVQPHTVIDIELKTFILLTEPSGEQKASDYLFRRGFCPYVPLENKTVAYTSRSLFRLIRRHREVKKPIFPGYLFLPLNIAWDFGPVHEAPGLRRVNERAQFLRRGDGAFQVIDDYEMAKVMDIERNINNPESPESRAFKVGDKVRVLDGPFADQIAEVRKMSDRQRVELLMNILGGGCKVIVRDDQITAA